MCIAPFGNKLVGMTQMAHGKRGLLQARRALRLYAVFAGLLGLLLFGWGPMWFGLHLPGFPYGKGALVRAFGSVWIFTAAFATALATIEDARSQQKALFWFAAGHAALWLAVLSQVSSVFGYGVGDLVVTLLGTITFCLFYLWLVTRSASTEERSGKTEPLRSRYEREIRQAVAQEERNRLARDLHDSIKQQIFAIQTGAATAQARFTDDPQGARDALDQIRVSAREAMTEMEVMLDQLRSAPLGSVGLLEALKKLCESIEFRTGANVQLTAGDLQLFSELAPGAAEAALRVAQEALANVARHARATHVVVSIDATKKGVDLSVSDDGAGFLPHAISTTGMGVRNMRTRAEELGGTLNVSSVPGKGATVRLFIPQTRSAGLDLRSSGVAFILLTLAMCGSAVLGHWSMTPAMFFIGTIAAFHYRRHYRETAQ